MSIHKEGINFLVTVAVCFGTALFFIHKLGSRSFIKRIFTYTMLFTYLFLIYFFRNPVRKIVYDANKLLAPADGRIVNISKVYEGEYFKDQKLKVSIFMSPLNVHINRSPISGWVKYVKYHPGKYLIAFREKASNDNERTTIVFTNEKGNDILVRQIAGFIARRIKYYVQSGSYVVQGHEIGFIKFGSRVDIYFPIDAKLKIKLGEKVKGGLSVLAEL